MPWFWTDDLARLLTDRGHEVTPTLERWLRLPQAVRADGEPQTIAERMIEQEEEGEPRLAA